MLAEIAAGLQIANSAKNLFSSGSSEGDSMKKQVAWQQYSALNMPLHQVEGLRRAGLNPMLAVGKGIEAPPNITSSPGKDAEIATARQLASQQGMVAAATVQNLESASAKNLADAALAKAQTITEGQRPENVSGDTNLKFAQQQAAGQLALLHQTNEAKESFNVKIAKTESQLRNLELSLAKLNLPGLRKAEADRAIALARSAKTTAEVDEALLMLERSIGAGGEALGAVAGAVSSASGLKRALDAAKPRTRTRSGRSSQQRGQRSWSEQTTDW